MDDEDVTYIGGPWDGQHYRPAHMMTKAVSMLRKDDGTQWGPVRYEPDPLTGDYLYMGTW